MATRSVDLTDREEELLGRLVESGRFQDVDEALRAGLGLLEEDEARMDALVERLNRAHREALEAPPPSETGEEQVRRIFREARARYEARQAKAS